MRRVAGAASLVEEFITARVERFRPSVTRADSGSRVLVHGHCYPTALTGTDAQRTMLGLTGWTVGEINAGCCGLAGSFGYEAEHYAISMLIGEDRLFPAVRHPIELLADALAD